MSHEAAAREAQVGSALVGENERLREENFWLAAWQCPFRDGSGLTGDEGGSQYCARDRELAASWDTIEALKAQRLLDKEEIGRLRAKVNEAYELADVADCERERLLNELAERARDEVALIEQAARLAAERDALLALLRRWRDDFDAVPSDHSLDGDTDAALGGEGR